MLPNEICRKGRCHLASPENPKSSMMTASIPLSNSMQGHLSISFLFFVSLSESKHCLTTTPHLRGTFCVGLDTSLTHTIPLQDRCSAAEICWAGVVCELLDARFQQNIRTPHS